ncbi:cell division protein PerM [Nocardioides donggukensis]|uniref:Uncharacterized protein n=1 Tax=Nocardioides donggukensis TaxID=2774019 RepID=A0A927Q0N4_9ACTN|nr:DUF6350 family protein [Nocardioides donggukensis]MBD8868634.1 hypothetical protein [Nocardioides donggukensis]
MTATLSPPRATAADAPRRPLTLLATAAGLSSAVVPLAVCLGVALAGWFLADAGMHGTPRDALRTGGTAWLMAHGAGVDVRGTAVTVVPLGVTLLVVWQVWRSAVRLGESVAGHGPDAAALSDGDRDWTVAASTLLFTAPYLLVTVAAVVLSAGGAPGPAGTGPVLLWATLLAAVLGGIGIAIGSGRAAIWLSLVPAAVRAGGAAVASILLTLLGVSAAVFTGALLLDLGAAVNVVSRLHTDTGDTLLFVLLVLTLVPNAVLFAAAYLLGPGFAVGTGTLVSPSVVAIGPVPMFPLLAALPDNGPVPTWLPYLVVVPVLCAALGSFRAAGRRPTTAWDEGALRGLVAGVVAGVLIAALTAVAGGAVGPGRMAEVGPLAGQVLVHAIVALGIGGLLGGLAGVWWARRAVAA